MWRAAGVAVSRVAGRRRPSGSASTEAGVEEGDQSLGSDPARRQRSLPDPRDRFAERAVRAACGRTRLGARPGRGAAARPRASTRRALVRSIRSSERLTSNLRLPGSCSGIRIGEGAPLPGPALQVDVAAEELGQLADDREARGRSPGARGSGRRPPGPGPPAWRNFSKIFSRSSSAIPIPVSLDLDHRRTAPRPGPRA